MTANCAIKPIAEQALRPNQTIVPQRLIAALDLMTKVFVILLTCLLVMSCGDTKECRLCGTWKSDSVRTLDEMKSSTLLTEKQRELFLNDFFGKLTVELTPEMGRAYFPDQQPSEVPWERWEVVAEEGQKMTIKSEIEGQWKEYQIYLQGNCYRVEQPHLGFGEWFCRLSR